MNWSEELQASTLKPDEPYFAGLTLEQAAQALSVSRATASRYWSYAQAWLFHEINDGD